jgi:uncharacterized C2H2 Zn-finger protein
MLPLIHARFRKRRGVPYAVEQLSGRQFRCRHCNTVFFREKDLDKHIERIPNLRDKSKPRVSPEAPELSTTTDVRVLYTYDISDRLKRQWLKLRKGDVYDGI